MSDKNTKKPVIVSVYEGPSAEEMDEDMDIWKKAYELSRKEIAHHDGFPYSEASLPKEYNDY